MKAKVLALFSFILTGPVFAALTCTAVPNLSGSAGGTTTSHRIIRIQGNNSNVLTVYSKNIGTGVVTISSITLGTNVIASGSYGSTSGAINISGVSAIRGSNILTITGNLLNKDGKRVYSSGDITFTNTRFWSVNIAYSYLTQITTSKQSFNTKGYNASNILTGSNVRFYASNCGLVPTVTGSANPVSISSNSVGQNAVQYTVDSSTYLGNFASPYSTTYSGTIGAHTLWAVGTDSLAVQTLAPGLPFSITSKEVEVDLEMPSSEE